MPLLELFSSCLSGRGSLRGRFSSAPTSQQKGCGLRKGFSELAVYFVDIYGQVTKSDTYPFSFKGSVSFKAGSSCA